jgi:glutathione S-transferase
VYGYTHLADEGGFELSQFKHITAWIARVQEQPGYLPIDQLLTGQKQSLAA